MRRSFIEGSYYIVGLKFRVKLLLFYLCSPQSPTASLLLSLALFLLFFRLSTSFLSSPDFLPSVVRLRPCLADDPTPDPTVAPRSLRIASLPVGGEAAGID